MYVFQFMDGTYRIDFWTHFCRKAARRVYDNPVTAKLFDGSYETRAAAEEAKARIKELLAA